MRRATFINIKLYIEGTRVILLSFTESCKWWLVVVGSFLMMVMYVLSNFESDRNDGERLTGTWGTETWGVGTCVFGGN